MQGLLALLLEAIDLQIQMLDLFLQLPFALGIALQFRFGRVLGQSQRAELGSQPMALAGLGPDQAIQRAPLRIHH